MCVCLEGGVMDVCVCVCVCVCVHVGWYSSGDMYVVGLYWSGNVFVVVSV